MSVLIKVPSPADVAAIRAKTDNLPSDPADQSLLEALLDAQVRAMDFWSDVDDVVQSNGFPTDTALPDVVVSGLPSGAAIHRVVAILKVRALENTNAGSANALSGAQNIQVRKAGGSWVPAINLVDNQWTIAASTREAGDVQIGDIDLKATVDGDGTYNFQIAAFNADVSVLRLNEVMMGLRFYLST